MPRPWITIRDERLLRTRLRTGPGYALGEFVCRPGHAAWVDDNRMGPSALIVFPGRPVEIAQQGRPRVVANANVAMFYDPGRCYRRRLVDPRGDACRYYALPTSTLREIVGRHDAREGDDLFAWARGPVRPEVRLRFERLPWAMDEGLIDDLGVAETLLDLTDTLVADAALAHRGRRPRAGPTDRRHEQAARELEEVVSRRFREGLTLEELAAEAGLSPYHAARLFRRHTGSSLHAYRDQLRVRAALAALRRGRRLDELALELGFASHAHLTDRFRRTFGVAPSTVRP